jgi:hypothetical protein
MFRSCSRLLVFATVALSLQCYLVRTCRGSHDLRLPNLLAKLRERHDRIRSLRVVCRAELKGQPTLPIETVLAASGHRRMNSLWHYISARPERDYFAFSQYYDGSHFGLYSYLNGRWEVTARFAVDRYVKKARENFVTEALGWWPPGDPTPPLRPSGDLVYLIDILSHPDIREVDEAASEIEGFPCRTLEVPSQVRMWVDSETLDIRQREYFAKADQDPADVAVRYLLQDFREVTTGVRLPFRIVRVGQKGTYRSEATVLSYEVNSIGDEAFEFTPPPGALVYYRDEDRYEQIPGGIEIFDGIIAAGREAIAQRSEVNGSAAPGRIFVAYVCGLMAVVVLAEGLRLRQGRAEHARSLQ